MAGAWVGGTLVVRLAQGVVFGLILGGTAAAGDQGGGPGPVASALLLVVAVLFYVGAARKALKQPDDDAPPPGWMTALEGVRPGRAFLLGVGVVLVAAKLWAFTLGAIAVIRDADLGQAAAIAWYLVFVAMASSVHLGLVGTAYLSPTRSAALLDAVNRLLERYQRPLMIGLGVVFGTLFLLKALEGLGVR